MLDEEGQSLAPLEVRSYRLDDPSSFKVLAHFRRLLAETLRELVDFRVDFGVGDLDRLLRDDGTQREIRTHRAGRAFAHAVDERLLILARSRQILRDGEARRLLFEPVREIVQTTLHLLAHERVGNVVGDELRCRRQHLVAYQELRLHPRVEVETGAHVVAQRVDGFELADLGDPLVGELGQHLALRVLHQHLEGHFVAGALAEPLGKRVVELEDVAGALAAELLVELRHDDARTHLVEVVGGREALDRLVVDVALDVDLGVVAVLERPRGVLELGEPVTERVDLAVDRLVGDRRARDLDLAARRGPRP